MGWWDPAVAVAGLVALFMRDLPEDIVYKLLSAFYANKDKLASIDSGFTALASDFVGLQVSGIKANPTIPVHAGLAKFLKEHKAWDDKWTVAKSS